MAILLALFWAAAALTVDVPAQGLRVPLALTFTSLAILIISTVRPILAAGCCAGLFAIVLVWWLTLAPSNNRPWQSDVARTPYSEIHNGEVTIHNVRNFDYVTETDYHPVWETRTYQISQISGIDLFMDYWGSPAIAHTILSFEFSDNPPLAMSIETRKEVGETFGHSWFFSPI